MTKLAESISKVRLRGGVVGKVSIMIMLVAPSMAAISWSVSSVWISAAALVLVFTLTLVAVLKMIGFARENPQAALYEGAEFLVHERMKMGMKDLPELREADQVPTLPIQESSEPVLALEANEADRLPPPAAKRLPKSKAEGNRNG